MSNGQRKDVDHLVHMWPPEMGTDDEVAFLVDQDLVPVDRLRLLASSEPAGVLVVGTRSLMPFSLAAVSLRPTAAIGGMVNATLGKPA